MTNNSNVALDLERVSRAEAKGEFLEGIAVRDRAFEAWLLNQRREVVPPVPTIAAAMTPQLQSARLFFQPDPSADSTMIRFAELYSEGIWRTMSETLFIEPMRGVYTRDYRPSDHIVRLTALKTSEHALTLQLSLETASGGDVYWTGNEAARMQDALPLQDVGLLALGNRMLQALSGRLKPPGCAAVGPDGGAQDLFDAPCRAFRGGPPADTGL